MNENENKLFHAINEYHSELNVWHINDRISFFAYRYIYCLWLSFTTKAFILLKFKHYINHNYNIPC